MTRYRTIGDGLVINGIWLAAVAPILALGAAPLWAWLAMGGSLIGGNILGWAMTRR